MSHLPTSRKLLMHLLPCLRNNPSTTKWWWMKFLEEMAVPDLSCHWWNNSCYQQKCLTLASVHCLTDKRRSRDSPKLKTFRCIPPLDNCPRVADLRCHLWQQRPFRPPPQCTPPPSPSNLWGCTHRGHSLMTHSPVGWGRGLLPCSYGVWNTPAQEGVRRTCKDTHIYSSQRKQNNCLCHLWPWTV